MWLEPRRQVRACCTEGTRLSLVACGAGPVARAARRTAVWAGSIHHGVESKKF